MEAVAADAVLLVELIGQSVHEVGGLHALAPGGVEHAHHGGVGQGGLTAGDAHQVGGVVERSQGDALLHGRDDVVVDDDGAGELLTAMDHAVTHGRDLGHILDDAHLGVGQDVEDHLYGHFVVGHVLLDLHLVAAGGLVGEHAAVDADALAEALGDDGLGVDVDELILEGGAAGVDDENILHTASLSIMLRPSCPEPGRP